MPLQATSGAASYDAFGGGVAAVPNYIEDVFSTYLYTGNGSTQTITNGIDLSTKGGLVWIKDRAISSAQGLFDTVSGATKYVQAQSSTSQNTDSTTLTSFNSNGFSLGSNGNFNSSASSIAAWTFRQQAKFFTVVSWTGNGANRAINHDLGSVPGCILIKCKSNVGTNWAVYHRSIANTEYLTLNTTDAKATNTTYWNSTTPTNTQFSLGTSSLVNANGFTYVAYLFAHNAGGFGLTGTDNVISCGSYTGTGAAGNIVTLGYEPQWIMIKRTDSAQVWTIYDNMRGIVTGGNDPFLIANYSDAETTATNFISVNATGFSLETLDQQVNGSSGNYIYIAIRRGPMKVPTSGASVFIPIASSAAAGAVLTTGFPIDMQIGRFRDVVNGDNSTVIDRLRGVSTNSTQSGQALITSATSAEAATTNKAWQWSNADFKVATDYGSTSSIYYNFKRAPGFFDEVCYTGTGAGQVVSHNLGVVPQLMIFKCRSTAGTGWIVTNAFTGYMSLNLTTAQDSTTPWDFNGTAPTATQLTTRAASNGSVNASGSTYVAYLFATCAGVSKVGLYTGTGTTLQVDCGFTGGARFVLIKRTNSTGDWYVWDSARGIVSGNDPYLLLNSTAAEVTTTDYIDTYSAGFEISSTAPAAINASGGTFIFLAIA